MFVSFDDVSVSFGKRRVIEHLSFTVERGTSHALVGPSGAGKSTILGLIAGQITPQTGRVTGEFDAQQLAWIVQSSPVFSHRSALDNVAIGALATGINQEEANSRAQQALDLVGLTPRSLSRASVLSGGERQRVAVARGIAAQAQLILADEPTASLDATSRDAVLSALTAAVATGCTLVLATHDPHVKAMADAITVVNPAGE